MSYSVTRDEERLIVRVGGRLDAQSSPLLADEMRGMLDDVAEIDFDLSELEYISSAGMRVLLASYKLMQKREGTMQVENAQDSVLETLQMSGFASLFAMSL